MAREVQRVAFQQFQPVQDYAKHFGKGQRSLRSLCLGGRFRPNGNSQKAWLRGATRFPDEFERAAHESLVAGDRQMFAHIDDPWKLTGHTRDEISPATLDIAWRITRRVTSRTASERLGHLMFMVERHGMAPPEMLDVARWLGKASYGWSVQFASGWAALALGYYAREWTPEDLAWLVTSGTTPEELSRLVFGLIGNDYGGVQGSEGLPFPFVRMVITEGLAVEYTRELLMQPSSL